MCGSGHVQLLHFIDLKTERIRLAAPIKIETSMLEIQACSIQTVMLIANTVKKLLKCIQFVAVVYYNNTAYIWCVSIYTFTSCWHILVIA